MSTLGSVQDSTLLCEPPVKNPALAPPAAGFSRSTGETKVRLKLEYPYFSGVLTTAGNLVFVGHLY